MSPPTRRRLALAGLLALAAGGVVCGAARAGNRAPDPPRRRAVDDTTLDARFPRERYLVGEPILVEVTVENLGSTPRRVKVPDLRLGTLVAGAIAADGSFRIFLGGPGVAAAPEERRLEPGEKLRREAILHFDWHDAALGFPRPGRYHVRVALLVAGQDPGEKSRASIEAFIERQPDTLFADYARYFLARLLERPRTGRPADPAAALRLLDAIRRDDFPLRAQALLLSAGCERALGRTEQARARIARVRAEFSGSLAAEGAEALERRMRLGWVAGGPEGAGGAGAGGDREPLGGERRDQIEATLERFFAAYQARDLQGCLALVAPGVRVHEREGVEQMRRELQEDFEAVRLRGPEAGATWRLVSAWMEEAGPVAEVEIRVRSAPGAAPSARGVRIGLSAAAGGRWLVSSWDRRR